MSLTHWNGMAWPMTGWSTPGALAGYGTTTARDTGAGGQPRCVEVWGSSYVERVFSAARGQHTHGVAISARQSNSIDADQGYFWQLLSGATPVLTFKAATDGLNVVYELRAGGTAGTLLASLPASASLQASTTARYYELVADFGAGTAQVWVAGITKVADVSGVSWAAATVDRIRLGAHDDYAISSTTAVGYDDYYDRDDLTRMGGIVVPHARPTTKAGAAWSGAVNNIDDWQVDVVFDATCTTDAAEMTGAVEDLTLATTAPVDAVRASAIVLSPAGNAGVDVGYALSGTPARTASGALGTEPALVVQESTTKPGGGSWTVADVNGLTMTCVADFTP